MLPKKLFTAKCLHVDRDIVFCEDIENFFSYVEKNLNKELSENVGIEEPIHNDKDKYIQILTYNKFKSYWNTKNMSMLHFSKSKEENQKEYYEVLFGEIQKYILTSEKLIYNILSIYTIYSLYYTQITEYFYQINTIPEIMIEFNKTLIEVKQSSFAIAKTLALMINRLYKDEAFSVGCIIGIKTIILNKYGLPMEQKANVYKDYVEINNTKRYFDKLKFEDKEKSFINKKLVSDYTETKRDTVEMIKSLGQDFNSKLYCDFMNYKLNTEHKTNNEYTFYMRDFETLNLNDFETHKFTNLNLHFDQIDNV
jgi:hypothetical protein